MDENEIKPVEGEEMEMPMVAPETEEETEGEGAAPMVAPEDEEAA